MALTNYLAQTVLGLLVLTTLLGNVDFLNRGAVLVFVFAVWALLPFSCGGRKHG